MPLLNHTQYTWDAPIILSIADPFLCAAGILLCLFAWGLSVYLAGLAKGVADTDLKVLEAYNEGLNDGAALRQAQDEDLDNTAPESESSK